MISDKDRPRIVCLCGSTRFKADFETIEMTETLKGNIVLTVGVFGHADGIELSPGAKVALDELHLRKIDLADEVLVINVGGYLGESTRKEIAYARRLEKAIQYLEPHGGRKE